MRTPITKAIDNILIGVLAVVVVTAVVYVVNKMRDKTNPAGIHVAAFKTGDCFIRNGVREAWEPEADGKVIFKGITKYMLMGSEEAERRSGGDKLGFPQSIESFDMNHRKVLCPLAWAPKRIEKPK